MRHYSTAGIRERGLPFPLLVTKGLDMELRIQLFVQRKPPILECLAIHQESMGEKYDRKRLRKHKQRS